MKSALRRILGFAALVVATSTCHAQKMGWEGPLTIVVPFGPGTGLDAIARSYAIPLASQLGTSVVVDNKAGAGGLIGTIAAARATPNGSTLLLTAEYPFLSTPHMQAGSTYAISDFAGVAKVAVVPHVLVVSEQSEMRGIDDLVKFAKANPGKLSYASSGEGASSHLYMEGLLRGLGITAVHVPYKNTGQAMSDVVGSQIPLYLPSLSAALPLLRAGKLRALVVGSPNRVADLPQVPTFAEVLRRPGETATVWFGFLAPKGTPRDVVDRLEREIVKASQSEAVRSTFVNVNADPVAAGSRAFDQDLRTGNERTRNVLEAVGITSTK